jgi:hypothetical protein
VRPAILILCALLVASCGGERTFEPEEFVDEANAAGAGLALGEPLTSIAEGVDVYALEFTAPVEETDGHGHGGGGSLVVTEDSGSATDEFERCEAAVSLTCYRAANVVLYFEAERTDERLIAVERAITELGSE